MLDLSLPQLTLPAEIKVEGCILSTTQQNKMRSQANVIQSLRKQIERAHQEADRIRNQAKVQAQTLIEDEKSRALSDFMDQLDFIFEEAENDRRTQWQLMQTTTLTMLEQALSMLALKVPTETKLKAILDLMETHTKQTLILDVTCHSSALDRVTMYLSTKPLYSSTCIQVDDTLSTDELVFESRSGRYRVSWKQAISTLSAIIQKPVE
ncbi:MULTISPECIES: HrpE/YscL family type III secretion apparatus protein [Vibrio]|uniref:HrpE/YscL family type III secretion apparatus protein n=1 Tax=Vibrio TaxID=662 RepID=UPI0001B953E0|nr:MULTISPECIES: HrpE/YscL family type III secretion apparatus protein [Vibrio]EEX34241.1 hypothetical protein VIC_001035 [Vibrio coralliilyticus ATCC BAA-450]MDE3898650.1 hypothetical protein [Vibrio sp. CC007]